MDKIILHTGELTIGYTKPLIRSVNLQAYEGELICIIGRNGTGKSTLLNTLSGIINPLSGNIYYNDKNFTKLSLRERSTLISYVPSRQEYLSNLTVLDIVSLGRSPYTNIFDKKNSNDTDIIYNAIHDFNLEGLKDRHLYEISDGERQRAMICRAIVQQTPVILLDEPTAFLDYYTKQKLLNDLDNLAEEKRKCIIFSSHDIELSLRYARSVWLFNDDKIESYTVQYLKESGLLKKLMNFEFS